MCYMNFTYIPKQILGDWLERKKSYSYNHKKTIWVSTILISQINVEVEINFAKSLNVEAGIKVEGGFLLKKTNT